MESIAIGIALAGWFTVLALLALLVYTLAYVKIFFTAPKEGTAEAVMRGNALDRFILAWRGKRLAGPSHTWPAGHTAHPYDPYEIVPDTGGIQGFLHYLNPLTWGEAFGIYWIGVWPFFQIYRYDFVWVEERLDENGKLMPRMRRATKDPGTEGQTSFIRVNDLNYFITASNVKTGQGENIPLNLILVVTVRIVNPAKALFSGEDWLERTNAAAGQMVIKYAGQLKYDQVVASAPVNLKVHPNEPAGDFSLEGLVCTLSDGKPNELFGVDLKIAYGVEILAVKIHKIEFAIAEDEKRLNEATTQRYVSEQEGLAEAAKAQGQATAINTLAEAERERINKVYGAIAGNPDRMAIRGLEALEKAGEKGGATIVVPDAAMGLGAALSALNKKGTP